MEIDKNYCASSKTSKCQLLGVHSLSTTTDHLIPTDFTSKEPHANHSSNIYATHLSEEVHSDGTYPKLTIGMFFEFMKTAYHVNENIEKLACIITGNSEIDWSKLTEINLNLEMCSNDTNISDNKDSLEVVANRCGKIDYPNLLETHNVHTPSNDIKGIKNSVIGSNLNEHDTDITKQSSNEESLSCQSAGCAEKQLLSFEHNFCSFMREAVSVNNTGKKKNCVESVKFLHLQPNTTVDLVLNAKEIVTGNGQNTLTKVMMKNLGDILHEGLLDSVLPYMLPKPTLSQPIIKKFNSNTDVKKHTPPNSSETKLTSASLTVKEKEYCKLTKKTSENEVEIHVCDESKNIKKDFRCSQKLLIQNMCYFADVATAQKLEEIDISVHCDIAIFEWLMKWVKRDILRKSEWPTLEASNVISIMVSAAFLQMELLLKNCLQYCHDNMSEILKTSSVLTCLNDNLLTRLAELFTNEEVEVLKDKKDKIQSRLYCKLIVSLATITPDNSRGHYSSLATLFKCTKCRKNIIQSISDFIPCISNAMKIDNKGNVYSKHVRDLTWTLNDYITTLRSDLRSWRKVYWRLWGDCHYFSCQQCNTYFPIHQMAWCYYHPQEPQFFLNEQQRNTSLPLGRYPCCSQRAYRFTPLPNQNGCKYKEHTPHITSEKDVNILNIFAANKEIICMEPPQLFFPEKITRLIAHNTSAQSDKLTCSEIMWWTGMQLVPIRPKLGLLGKIWGTSEFQRSTQLPDGLKKDHLQNSVSMDVLSSTSSLTNTDEDDTGTGYEDSSIDEDYNTYSERSNTWSTIRPINKIGRSSKKGTIRKCWSINLIIRYNQDNQRDFEERAAKQMIILLTKRTSPNCTLHKSCNRQHSLLLKSNQPVGGTYVKLAAEFREQWAQSYKYKNSLTGKNVMRIKTHK